MARYIDADKVLEVIKETNANYHWLLAQYNAQWVYDFIESQPTADVIPKSEVFAEIGKVFERLKKRECSNAVCTWCVHANSYGQRNEECDKPYIDKNEKEQRACYAYAKFESNIDNEFAELKKKYTED